MFGDILSELSSVLEGSRGMGYSADVNPEGISSFRCLLSSDEPKGIANPVGLVLAGARMFETLGEKKAAARVEKAVVEVLREGKVRSLWP